VTTHFDYYTDTPTKYFHKNNNLSNNNNISAEPKYDIYSDNEVFKLEIHRRNFVLKLDFQAFTKITPGISNYDRKSLFYDSSSSLQY